MRRDEIAQGLMARVCALADPDGAGPEYVTGLREAVSAALDYGLAAIDPATRTEHVPAVLAEQARAAARNGIGLDTVLRRYVAGYMSLSDHVLAEAERDIGVDDNDLRRALRDQSMRLDRVLAVVTDAYTAEIAERRATGEGRRSELVRRLLDGHPVDAAELNYKLEGWHLAVVAGGPSAVKAIRELAALADRRLLVVCPEGATAWAWLGGRDRLSAADLQGRSVSLLRRYHGVAIAVGQAAEGVGGLRLSHRQARAAFVVAARVTGRLVSYCDVALVATAWQDDVLARSLSEMFLAPLAKERDGGTGLLETLRAYFDAACNVASTASRLGTSRQTVNARLRTVEEHIGRSLDTVAPEVETALGLWELRHPTALAAMSQYAQRGNPRLSHSR